MYEKQFKPEFNGGGDDLLQTILLIFGFVVIPIIWLIGLFFGVDIFSDY